MSGLLIDYAHASTNVPDLTAQRDVPQALGVATERIYDTWLVPPLGRPSRPAVCTPTSGTESRSNDGKGPEEVPNSPETTRTKP